MSESDAIAAVTGAAAGIGAATASALASSHELVLAVDRQLRTAPAPQNVREVLADVRDDVAMEQQVFGRLDRLDTFVACAGAMLSENFLEADAVARNAIIDLNLRATLANLQAAARRIVASGRGGSLIVISSTAGVTGEAGLATYSATKAAQIAVVEALAVELAPYDIRVNGVAPGNTKTAMNAGLAAALGAPRGLDAAAIQAEQAAAIPAGRFAEPEEIAAAIAFLAGPCAAYITGATIKIDGGETLA